MALRAEMLGLLDSSGAPVHLGPIVGRGGEGCVYELVGAPDAVVKLYTRGIDPSRARKLTVMCRMARPPLLSVAAWPIDLVFSTNGAQPAGLVMPRVVGHKEIHLLYGPKSRLESFPEADWRFLLHVAANTARAFAVVHEHGHVVGDVNHGNILASPAGTVRFIDCDSFQIADGELVYTCDVGVATHTPPELQGLSLRGLTRTRNHDLFGLAVLIFQTLFMGRHPFVGSAQGPRAGGDYTVEKAIARCLFAYGPGARARHLKPPPLTLRLDALPPQMVTLFEAAFSRAASLGAPRPSARDWLRALSQLQGALQPCPKTRSHVFPVTSKECPWCQIEGPTGVHLFGEAPPPRRQAGHPLRGAAAVRPEADPILEAWSRTARVLPPPADPPVGACRPCPPPPADIESAGRRRRAVRLWAGITATGGVLAAVALGSAGLLKPAVAVLMPALPLSVAVASWRPRGVRYAELQVTRCTAAQRLGDARKRWDLECSASAFSNALEELSAMKRELDALAGARNERVNEMHEGAADRRAQLARHLDSQRVAAAHIGTIGPARKALLESYGIETAADITAAAIRRIPGFDRHTRRLLLCWRADVENEFCYDPARRASAGAIARLDADLAARRGSIEAELLDGPRRLDALRVSIACARTVVCLEIAEASQALAAAEAAVRAM